MTDSCCLSALRKLNKESCFDPAFSPLPPGAITVDSRFRLFRANHPFSSHVLSCVRPLVLQVPGGSEILVQPEDSCPCQGELGRSRFCLRGKPVREQGFCRCHRSGEVQEEPEGTQVVVLCFVLVWWWWWVVVLLVTRYANGNQPLVLLLLLLSGRLLLADSLFFSIMLICFAV